jgi:hypothetical protein
MAEKHQIIREVRLFEAYIKYIWPFHRRLVGKRLTRRCSRCILPESYAPLHDGLCIHCREEIPRETGPTPAEEERMQLALDEQLQAVSRRRDCRYHAIVLFSGGKDSSYLLHRLMRRYPDLRLLALTVDNTFMSPVAMENVQEIVRRLGVEHMVLRPRAATVEKMFRYAITHLNERGCAGTVDQFDGDFFSDLARNLAAAMGVPYIICGLSRVQVETILEMDAFITSVDFESRAREQVAGIRLRDVFTPAEMHYWWNGLAWPAQRRPRMIFPFYIWNLDEAFIKTEVLRLGLMPRGDESPLITNHRLIPLMGIVDMIRFGYSSFEPEFARMVRTGKADRRQWLYAFETLEYAARTGRFLGSAVDEALLRLALRREDVGLKGGKDVTRYKLRYNS